MHNIDTNILAFIFITRFAETYGKGTYGSEAYSETSPSSSAAVSPSTPVQTSEAPATTASQPNSQTPPMTTTAESSPQPNSPISPDIMPGLDLTGIVIGSVVAMVTLVALFVVIAKKLRR